MSILFNRVGLGNHYVAASLQRLQTNLFTNHVLNRQQLALVPILITFPNKNLRILTMTTTCQKIVPSKGSSLDDLDTNQECENNDCAETQSQRVPSKPAVVPQLSKRAQKKLLRKEKLKEQRKAKQAPDFSRNTSPGFSCDIFGETDYYFENGLRKVYPYPYTFSTYAKERWYGRTIQDIFENEFRIDSPDNFRSSVTKGLMRVNGGVIGLDYVLKNGDLIEHCIHRHENPVSGEPIEIIEDTPEMVVINKPSSIPCHPCGKFRFNSIVFIMGKEFGYANLRNIYRLDRLTSGVLIMGKTARKTKELENQVLHRHVHKEYVARVFGEFPEQEIEVNQPLSCLSHKITLWQVKPGGKPSRTTFKRLSYNGKTSVVKCIPHTGRTHQIRVHLQYLGHPIVNDPYYNSPAWGPLRGKEGHCDVQFEELCKRIMQEHNVGLWLEGENQLVSNRLLATSQEFTDCAVDTLSPNLINEESSQPSASSPKTKKLKLSTEKVSGEESKIQKSCLDVGGDYLLPNDDSNTDSCVHQSQLNVKTNDVNEFTSLCTSPVEGRSIVSDVGGSSSKTVLAIPKDEKIEQKSFDSNLWIPDPLCESCHLKYIDPQPCDLLLYLHAYRYSGPSWDYSAKLPAWAREDWVEPEEYNKYLNH